MQMAERPDRFISPARSMSGPGISAAVRGTSMWLWVSIPTVLATNVGNSRIDRIRRPARSRTQHDGGPCRHSNGGEKLPPGVGDARSFTAILVLQHISPDPSSLVSLAR